MNSLGWNCSWVINVPGQLVDKPTHQPDDLPDLDEAEGVFGCQTCGKQYTRRSGLDKHLETHNRPFRCPVRSCRYHTFGWPNEKELGRHFNDKHSSEPPNFPCLWPNCDYTSKRESNCKQHMEKSHGYHYARTRARNREDGSGRLSVATGDVQFDVTHPDNTQATHSVPDVLLTPNLLGQCSPMTSGAFSPMGFKEPCVYGTDIFSPWTSPVTSLGDHHIPCDDSSRACTRDTAVAIQDNEWLKVPVDPRLCSSSSELYQPPENALRGLPTLITTRTSPTVTTQILTPVSEQSPISVHESDSKREPTTPHDGNPSGGQSFGNQGLGVTQSGHMNTLGKRHVRFTRDQGDDDSDGDDEPQLKRMKTPGANDEENGDPKMICPFRKANPEIYDLNVHSKYWSCHTEHNNISTVVRHLGRPAHNLDVDNARQAISSFNVVDNEHGHPAAGLCKKCWRTFTDRETFETHFRTKCETVSRSKREKFQILMDTFCWTSSSRSAASTSSSDDDEPSDDAERGANAGSSAPLSAAGATNQQQDVVSRQDFLALVERVAALERIISNTRQQTSPRILPSQQATVARAFSASPAMGSQAFGYYAYETGPSPTTTVPGRDPRTTGTMAGGTGQSVVWSRPEIASPLVASPRPQQPAGAGQRLRLQPVQYEAAANSVRVPNNTPTMTSQQHLPGGDESQQQQQQQQHQQQQSTDTMIRTHWQQPVQLGEQMMERVDFYGTGQYQHTGSTDELTKFLNLDSQ